MTAALTHLRTFADNGTLHTSYRLVGLPIDQSRIDELNEEVAAGTQWAHEELRALDKVHGSADNRGPSLNT